MAYVTSVRLVLLVKHQVVPAQTVVARERFVAHLTRKYGIGIVVTVARLLRRLAATLLRRLLGHVDNVVRGDGCGDLVERQRLSRELVHHPVLPGSVLRGILNYSRIEYLI